MLSLAVVCFVLSLRNLALQIKHNHSLIFSPKFTFTIFASDHFFFKRNTIGKLVATSISRRKQRTEEDKDENSFLVNVLVFIARSSHLAETQGKLKNKVRQIFLVLREGTNSRGRKYENERVPRLGCSFFPPAARLVEYKDKTHRLTKENAA